MKHYESLTEGLRAALMHYTRGGYRQAVVFDVPAGRVPGIEDKWAEVYGINLSGAKRYERHKKGLPNAVALDLPIPGNHGMRRLVLMATEFAPERLDPRSPWLREKWKDRVEIGDYYITKDKRDRGDYSETFKLTKHCLKGLDAYWRTLVADDPGQVVREAETAARVYTMFGGVRRQLRRLIRGYAKLYCARTKRPWPGPDPENLPRMGKFTKGEIKQRGVD